MKTFIISFVTFFKIFINFFNCDVKFDSENKIKQQILKLFKTFYFPVT